MNLPSLNNNWEATSKGLQQAAALLGAIRMLVNKPVKNFLELALRIEPNGLSAEMLPSGGSILLDFERATLVIRNAEDIAEIALNGNSQVSLLERLLETLDANKQAIAPKKENSFTKGFLEALQAKHHKLDGSLELTSTESLVVDTNVSSDYAQVLYHVFTAVSRWKARLNGFQTPIVVWSEHFDLSTLWFATNTDTESSPHINFGFAPFDGTHSRPYLYAYSYPMPKDFEKLPLSKPAQWHTASWKGVYVPYDDLANTDNPEALIERIFEEVYNTLAPTLQ